MVSAILDRFDLQYNMTVAIKNIKVKTVLTKSGIPGVKYCINPYVGCSHACRYCYATFMKKFTGHREPWGSFVDVKTNAGELLRNELRRAGRGNIMISSVTDPYQPVESKHRITRQCLEVIHLYQFPVSILTKSPLVLRDIDILRRMQHREVGLTISTDNDRIRRIFEPNAPPISDRIDALKKLHSTGIDSYVFIGPLLPMSPESLARQISPYAGSVLIDRMNYRNKTDELYRRHGLQMWLNKDFTEDIITTLKKHIDARIDVIC